MINEDYNKRKISVDGYTRKELMEKEKAFPLFGGMLIFTGMGIGGLAGMAVGSGLESMTDIPEPSGFILGGGVGALLGLACAYKIGKRTLNMLSDIRNGLNEAEREYRSSLENEVSEGGDK